MDKKNYTTKITRTKFIWEKPFALSGKENLIDNINLPEQPELYSKYTKKKTLNLQDPLSKIPLPKTKSKKIFLPVQETITLEILKKLSKFDRVNRQLKFWHNYKTNPIKAGIPILGNKTLFSKV